MRNHRVFRAVVEPPGTDRRGLARRVVLLVRVEVHRVFAVDGELEYPTGPRIELEPIGPRERLKAGESASFTEDWWLLAHPFPKKGQQLDLKALSVQVSKQTTETK